MCRLLYNLYTWICKGGLNLLKYRLPSCPYCDYKLNFLNAWIIKTDGEFKCPCCGETSNIIYKNRIKTLSLICSIAGVIITVCCLFLSNFFILGLFFTLLPFIYFYIMAPQYIRLKVIPYKNNKNNQPTMVDIYHKTRK